MFLLLRMNQCFTGVINNALTVISQDQNTVELLHNNKIGVFWSEVSWNFHFPNQFVLDALKGHLNATENMQPNVP